MRVLIKEFAWKVPLCVIWASDSSWINDESLTFWQGTVICFLFILSLDLIRWGLKKEK